MNKRIQELAEQAGQVRVFEINGVPILHYYVAGDGWVTIDPLVKKFAELIVAECSKVIRHGGQRKGAFGNEDLRPSEIATMIEEHFGVEDVGP